MAHVCTDAGAFAVPTPDPRLKRRAPLEGTVLEAILQCDVWTQNPQRVKHELLVSLASGGVYPYDLGGRRQSHLG
jgi:hypothetical protein